MEFAKRFCSWSRDLSPVSVKMIRAARFSVATMAVLNHIGCQNLQKGTILVLAVAVGGGGSTKKNATTQSTGEPLPALQAGQLIATFFGLLGGGNWRKTARGKAKGRASRALIIISHSKSKESSHSKRLWPRPSRAVLACTSKQNSSLIILLCRQAWASKVSEYRIRGFTVGERRCYKGVVGTRSHVQGTHFIFAKSAHEGIDFQLVLGKTSSGLKGSQDLRKSIGPSEESSWPGQGGGLIGLPRNITLWYHPASLPRDMSLSPKTGRSCRHMQRLVYQGRIGEQNTAGPALIE
ncbi:hypothetical protein ACOSQ4_028616 [Xanthoceras sorbifolium]